MDQLRQVFNAVPDVDFGPGTEKQIRYSVAQFKTILKRFLEEYIKGEPTWAGPALAGYSLYYDSAYTGGNVVTGNAQTQAPYHRFNMNGSGVLTHTTGNVINTPNFFDPISGHCPLIGAGPGREDADLTEIASGQFNWVFDLFEVATEAASWRALEEGAGTVWLKFSYEVFSQHVYPFVCNPSGEQGTVGGGPVVENNLLGIDYAGGGGGFFTPPTSSILLGDGTTSLFLWSPGAVNRFELDTLNTLNF